MKIKIGTLLAVSVLSASFASAHSGGEAKADIVQTASSAKGFSTLVAAVKAAGLVDALKGKGPFTVFAPTDEAFARLEKAKPGTLESLLKPENKPLLTKILTYHVVPGLVKASDVVKLKDGTAVKTLNGKSVRVGTRGGVTVDRAKVVKTDILCTNGVIHVIDRVILPE
ncbi:MAG TPA: fasciclin domain-containing protein [Fimbriimonas sp.]